VFTCDTEYVRAMKTVENPQRSTQADIAWIVRQHVAAAKNVHLYISRLLLIGCMFACSAATNVNGSWNASITNIICAIGADIITAYQAKCEHGFM
jgi:hypothetical protein